VLPGSSKTLPERVQLGDKRVQNWISLRGVDGDWSLQIPM